MTTIEQSSIFSLPLSWARTHTHTPHFMAIQLPYCSLSWIPTAEIPYPLSFNQVYDQLLEAYPHGFILQSSNLSLRDYLLLEGFYSLPMGAEAVLDLPWRGKRSVRELARRGRRHGQVREISSSLNNHSRLAQLIEESPSRQGKQLRYTERSGFDESVRGFVFEASNHRWLGAVTVSTPAPYYYHTEMILRHGDAPVGVMEGLVSAVAQQLEAEGGQHLSLGNVLPVPTREFDAVFGPHRHAQEQWRLGKLAQRAGQSFKFAFNAEGLWRFKNKFKPRWEPSYLVSTAPINWRVLAGLMQASGYFELVQDRLLKALPIPDSFSDTPMRSA
ncbi:MAG: phosphatidylglycerol lysyltransferase domain-containing protein [Chloroflexota bacterium]